MTELTVLEGRGERVAQELTRKLAEDRGIAVLRAESPSEPVRGFADILVVTAGYEPKRDTACRKIKCGILLVPGGTHVDFAEARSVVTYGMCPKNSITLSSISDNGCVLALQRELVTARGDILDRQEFIMRGVGSTDHMLATAGAILLAGEML